jgi:hypothetical protein
MNKVGYFILFFLFSSNASCSYIIQEKEKVASMDVVVENAIKHATKQSLILAKKVSELPGKLPKSIGKNGELETSTSDWWCSGFFPGVLWYLYEDSGNEAIKNYAVLLTKRIEKEQYNKDTHDLGFMLYCSFGNAFRITKDPSYKEVLVNGARSLSTRYSPVAGCIRSWDFNKDKWEYPTIIDNMMNLEYLMWAYNETKEDSFKIISISHSNRTIENQFRPDYSCYHVVSYSQETGKAMWKGTHQGLHHESAWARGQAWALYGYEMMYRETKDSIYLEQAIKIADFILNHPNLPEDKIPYWDFDAPNIPNTLRDASSAAIIASALVELSRFVDNRKRDLYINVAEKQLRTLSSPEYTVTETNQGFILKHSVGYFLANSEIDVPLTYADYYYVEALLRYKNYHNTLSEKH